MTPPGVLARGVAKRFRDGTEALAPIDLAVRDGDEPFAALDDFSRQRLDDELIALWRACGFAVVLVTHGVTEAVYLSTRVVVMGARRGRIVDEVAEFVAGTGGAGAGLAYQILLAGIQLNVPRLFAALVLIAAAGVALFGAAVLVAWLALGRWHESELCGPD